MQLRDYVGHNNKHHKKRDHAPAKMTRQEYEKELVRLEVELVKLQQWVTHAKLKVCMVNRAGFSGDSFL
jgi:polyphosphate kinase 2 (PPK2 family)